MLRNPHITQAWYGVKTSKLKKSNRLWIKDYIDSSRRHRCRFRWTFVKTVTSEELSNVSHSFMYKWIIIIIVLTALTTANLCCISTFLDRSTYKFFSSLTSETRCARVTRWSIALINFMRSVYRATLYKCLNTSIDVLTTSWDLINRYWAIADFNVTKYSEYSKPAIIWSSLNVLTYSIFVIFLWMWQFAKNSRYLYQELTDKKAKSAAVLILIIWSSDNYVLSSLELAAVSLPSLYWISIFSSFNLRRVGAVFER